jgi:hypothetical protein
LDSSGLVEWRDWMEERVRSELGIPFNPGAPAVRYEHSMGQSSFPTSILRRSTGPAPGPEPFPESNLHAGCAEPVELHSLVPGIPAT